MAEVDLTIILPMPNATIACRFGDSCTDADDKSYECAGIALLAPEGTPIVAPCEAQVVDFQHGPRFGPGAICLYHAASDLYLLLTHGRMAALSIGERVAAGTKLGEAAPLGEDGASGCCLLICVAKTFPADIRASRDPMQFLRSDPAGYLSRLTQTVAPDPDRARRVFKWRRAEVARRNAA